MGILLRKCILVFVILCPAIILPGASGVEQRDYDEALKEDEPAETLQQSERSTEYPNGVNVIPGSADIHYPTYDRIPKSAFSCFGRIPGFYADPELRCQVWHICDESGVQQSFLCTNGTIYSQDKRVCDWWYNVNCDPEEVSRSYEANKDLYKGPPPKDADAYEEATSNELPSPSPPSHKKPVQQQQQRPQQQQQRPQNYDQPQQQRPQPQQSQRPQNHEQQQPQRQQNHEQRPQNQNYDQPRQTPQQEQQRAEALKIIQNYENSQNSKSDQRPLNQDQEQQRAEALKIIQNYEQSLQAKSQQRPQNYEVPQARRQPPAPQQNNHVVPTQPSRPNTSPATGAVPEKKRVIVLRLPGPLPPGATIPPHILMEYAESVLAAERAGKAPPPGLVSSKTVPNPASNNGQHQQRPQTPPPNQQYQHRPQQQQQPQPRPQPTPQQQPQPTQPQPDAVPAAPRARPTPKGPTVPYTPRPFSAFLDAAVKYNGQSKSTQNQQQPTPQSTPPPQHQQHRPQQQSQPQNQYQQQQQQQQSRQTSPAPQQAQVQQQRRYEEPRPSTQQNYEQQQPQQRRPTQEPHQPRPSQQQQPSYYPEQEQEEIPQQQQQPQQSPQKKIPVQHKPTKSGSSPSPATDAKKFRHSTPRKHGEVRFAPKSSVSADDQEDDRQFHAEESRRPAYFNNFAPVPHLSQDVSPAPQTYQAAQQIRPKADIHLKTSFENEKVRPQRVQKQQHQEPASTTERYLTADEIHEPAIKRLVVVAGLKIKDPRNRQLTTPAPYRPESSGSSEETYTAERNYEPVRVIVARKSTTTTSTTPYPTSASTTTTTTTRVPQKQRHQQRPHQPVTQETQQLSAVQPDAAPATPRPRGTPKPPALPYTPRPFSAFLEDAIRFNGQSKKSTPAPVPEKTPEQQVYEEITQRPAMRRVIRKKIRTNLDQVVHTNVALNNEQTQQSQEDYQPQAFHKIPRTTTYSVPVSTTARPTKPSTTTTTTTTPYYQPEDYYEPTRATKNYGFDVYGRTDDINEEEELERAAQEYYQFSENYGQKQRY